MPEYLFGFRCRSPESCIVVQEIMKDDFTKIKTNPKNPNYDHTGIYCADTWEHALSLKHDLERKAPEKIVSIEITSGFSE